MHLTMHLAGRQAWQFILASSALSLFDCFFSITMTQQPEMDFSSRHLRLERLPQIVTASSCGMPRLAMVSFVRGGRYA
jgi:hypothetical protein